MSENTSESKPTTPSPTTPPPSNAFFQWMRDLGITREPGWLGGVAAGVAVRLGIDPIIVRGIFVVIALLGAPALLLYAAAWLLLPDLEGRIHLERLARGHFDGAVIGIGALVILAFVPFSQGIWFWGPWNWDVWGGGRFIGGALWNLLWTLAIIGGIVWLIVWLATRQGASRTPHDSVLYTASTASTAADAATSASGSTGTSAAFVAGASDAPVPPPATPPTDPDDLAAWKEQQAEWKREHAAWKAHQSTSAQERAAQERRLRAEQSAAQRTALAEEYRRTHPHPLFSLIMIGVALVAGAISALLVVGTGTWTHTATQVGLAVALGVLGLAVVINGLMGKRQGGAGGFAWLVAFALLFSSFGGIGGFSITGERNWRPSYQLDHSVTETHISGDVDLDLTDYFDASAVDGDDPDGHVTLRVIRGDVNVIVPADAHTFLHVSIVSGRITTDQETGDRRLSATDLEYRPLTPGSDNPELRVNVWVVSGNVTVTQAER